MSNPVNNNNSTYAPNTSLRPATSTTNTVSDPFAQSSDPFAQSNVQNSSGGATNRAAGRVVDNNTPSGINKSDPVAMPTGVTYAYPNYPGTMYAGGAAPPAFQTVYVGNQTSQGFGHSAPLQSAPEGRWRDGLFDCCSNLWPSCGCLFVFSGVWMVAQMAEKTNMHSFRNIVNLYFGMYILCFFISLFVGAGIMLLPLLLVWGLSIKLRLHVSGHYNIRGGACQEFLLALFFPCFSIPQIARHIYGYTKVYDGDSDPLLADYYPTSSRYSGTGGIYSGNNHQAIVRDQNSFTV